MNMQEYCRRLPKIELHAHLNGSLSNEVLIELGCNDKNVEEYQKLNSIFEKTDRTLTECFELFKVAQNVTTNKEAVYKACKSVIQDFANDNVIYLELRTTPRAEEGMSKSEYIEAVITAIKEAPPAIITKLLLSIDRRHDKESSDQSLQLIIDFFHKYPDIIVGVDLSGDPSKGKFDSELFKNARKAGLKISLHCAEIKNDKEVLEMLKFMPDRIGHATCLHPSFGGSQEIWELYSQTKIPAEFCLTSNVVCGTSESYEKHHIKKWIEDDFPFCLCTDDKGVFATSLSKELFLLMQHFGLSQEFLKNITISTVDYTFTTLEEKSALKTVIKNWSYQ